MANEEHVAILKKGPESWNEWRWRNRDVGVPDLSGADLRRMRLAWAELFGVDLFKADLSEANLEDADVRGARLHQADLTRARLGGADLSIANFREAVLTGADLSRAYARALILNRADLREARLTFANLSDADLSEANLRGADLTKVNLSNSNLDGADLSRAVLDETRLGNNDLSQVKGLEAVQHNGPSTIGIDTIYLSKGKIPEVFMRGAGVPEPFIREMKALVNAMEPIQFYSCFISYSSKDQEFAERLHADLQSKNVRCWFAPEDMKIGDRIRPRIDEAIRVHDKLLLVLTESSMKSAWVEKEVETAFEKERISGGRLEGGGTKGRTVLFPIRLDDAVMDAEEAWAADIRRTRHIGDFRGWKRHEEYKKAFERLMRI
jgi:hypothetical protein